MSSAGAVLVAFLMAAGGLALMPTSGATHGEGDPTCPSELRLTQLKLPGPVLINFEHAEGSNATNIYRQVADGEMEHIASVPAEEQPFYDDTNTTGGEEHTYEARAVFGEHESQDCPQETTFVREFSDPPFLCPDEIELDATANEDGTVTLSAERLDRRADLERREAGTEEWTFITTMNHNDTTHRDTTTDAQTTYEYRLIVQDDECDRAMVTAIPFFGNAIIVGLGAVSAVGAYAVVARRRD